MSLSGFNLKSCEQAYDFCHGNELDAVIYLLKQLCESNANFKYCLDHDLSTEELRTQWLDETEALESIFFDSDDPDFFIKDVNRNTVSIKIRSKNDTKLEIGISSTSNYPFELPSIILYSASLPAYIKLGILQSLTLKAAELLGSPMIYELVLWTEENIEQIINNPPTLLSLSKCYDQEIETSSEDKTLNSIMDQRTMDQVSNLSIPRKIAFVKNVVGGNSGNDYDNSIKSQFEALVASTEYQKMLRIREKLPSFKFKDQINDIVKTNQVLIVCGETGWFVILFLIFWIKFNVFLT